MLKKLDLWWINIRKQEKCKATELKFNEYWWIMDCFHGKNQSNHTSAVQFGIYQHLQNYLILIEIKGFILFFTISDGKRPTWATYKICIYVLAKRHIYPYSLIKYYQNYIVFCYLYHHQIHPHLLLDYQIEILIQVSVQNFLPHLLEYHTSSLPLKFHTIYVLISWDISPQFVRKCVRHLRL